MSTLQTPSRPSILTILGKLFKHLHGDSTITPQRIQDLNIECSYEADRSIPIFRANSHLPWSYLLRTPVGSKPIPQVFNGIIEDNPKGWNRFAHLLVSIYPCQTDLVPCFSNEEEVKNEYMEVYRSFYGAVDDLLLSLETGMITSLRKFHSARLSNFRADIHDGCINGYRLLPEERETLPADFYAFPDEEKKDVFYCGSMHIDVGSDAQEWWEWAACLAYHGEAVYINKEALKDAFWSERDVKHAFPIGYALICRIFEEMRNKDVVLKLMRWREDKKKRRQRSIRRRLSSRDNECVETWMLYES